MNRFFHFLQKKAKSLCKKEMNILFLKKRIQVICQKYKKSKFYIEK
ncbi:hypothetical protein Aoki45_27500 [Algoriphagus sp. oki45]|nr:hypothetical protein Aoki45_27500 [Algoriphagus sp. oki45]